MRNLFAAIMVAGAALAAGQALAADIPHYIEIPHLPPVDDGLEGSFYLRGSAAWNVFHAKEVSSIECPTTCGGDEEEITFPWEDNGYGYSFGAGFGYETGTGLRFDGTLDYLSNEDASITKSGISAEIDGEYSLNLRSTIALANAYYDFSFGGGHGHGYSAAGGAFGYVGAGVGVAFNHVSVDAPEANPIDSGSNTSLAAAGMAGVGYDFGAFTTDIGYRALYIADIGNGQPAPQGFNSENNWVHEVRGTVRYRFN